MRVARQQKIRLGVLFVVTCFLFLIVAARLVHLQVFKHAEYSEIVAR